MSFENPNVPNEREARALRGFEETPVDLTEEEMGILLGGKEGWEQLAKDKGLGHDSGGNFELRKVVVDREKKVLSDDVILMKEALGDSHVLQEVYDKWVAK